MTTSKKIFFTLLTLLLSIMFLHGFVEGRTAFVIDAVAERPAQNAINIPIIEEKWPTIRDIIDVLNGSTSILPGGPNFEQH